ncbi:unnamed protein product [Euphydryas editha]|uniref:Uncharacterized protein n=1 Tax=Euphydryas editha TaxID=104508 RepID=A0AAU9UR80_EUPED|nr:unnamed protein product [Euphydryas editha]
MSLNTMCRCCLVRPPNKDLKSVYTCQVDETPQIKEEESDSEENDISTVAEEERQENAGELEVEKHSCPRLLRPGPRSAQSRPGPRRRRRGRSFVNQDYSGSDPFSASDSSDEYQPSCEEDEEIKSDSDDSFCDKSTDNITTGTTKDGNNQTHSSDMPPTITQFGHDQLESSCVLPTITQQGGHLSSNLSDKDSSQRITRSNPQITKQRDHQQGQIHITVQAITELQTYLDTLQTAEDREPQQMKKNHMSQNTIEEEVGQLEEDVVPPTTEEHQSQAADCNGSVEKGRKKNFCIYCETHVLNFSRHIIRNHYLEVDVKKIIALPKKSQTRRNLLTQLKKKGNFVSNLIRCERPMRIEKCINESDYLPCPYCLGFYARNQLWKHKKKCNPEALEDGQADSFKGKSLDEININMDEELEGEGLRREDILDFIENTFEESGMAADLLTTTDLVPETPHKDDAASTYEPLVDILKTYLRSKKKRRVLVHWTTPQKNLVINHFKRHIRSKKAPKRCECDALKALHPELLQNKDWKKIKVFVQNSYKVTLGLD